MRECVALRQVQGGQTHDVCVVRVVTVRVYVWHRLCCSEHTCKAGCYSSVQLMLNSPSTHNLYMRYRAECPQAVCERSCRDRPRTATETCCNNFNLPIAGLGGRQSRDSDKVWVCAAWRGWRLPGTNRWQPMCTYRDGCYETVYTCSTAWLPAPVPRDTGAASLRVTMRGGGACGLQCDKGWEGYARGLFEPMFCMFYDSSSPP